MRRLIKDADGRIGGCVRRVARQQEIVQELACADHDVTLARELLDQYQVSLRQSIAHRDVLQRELHLLCSRLRREGD